MRRLATIFAISAVLAGCQRTETAQPAQPGERLGSGSINDQKTETIAVSGSNTYWTTARYTGALDILSMQFSTDVTWTGVCSSPVLECSNTYQSTVNVVSDESVWVDVTMTTSPPSLASGAQKFTVQFPYWFCAWARWRIPCASGAGNLVTGYMGKGG